MAGALHAMHEALLRSFCEQMAVPEGKFREMMAKKRVMPPGLGMALQRDLGVAYTSDNWLLEDNTARIGHGPARGVQTTRRMEQPKVDAPPHTPPAPRRRRVGRPVEHQTECSAWLRDIGQSNEWLAGQLRPSVSRKTVSSWNTGDRGIPEHYQTQIRAMSGGRVKTWPKTRS